MSIKMFNAINEDLRNYHEAAMEYAEQHDGCLPDDYDEEVTALTGDKQEALKQVVLSLKELSVEIEALKKAEDEIKAKRKNIELFVDAVSAGIATAIGHKDKIKFGAVELVVSESKYVDIDQAAFDAVDKDMLKLDPFVDHKVVETFAPAKRDILACEDADLVPAWASVKTRLSVKVK